MKKIFAISIFLYILVTVHKDFLTFLIWTLGFAHVIDIDKYLIILQSLLLRSDSSARFEGIYEESRAVFLCNEGEGHTGAKQRIPMLNNNSDLELQ